MVDVGGLCTLTPFRLANVVMMPVTTAKTRAMKRNFWMQIRLREGFLASLTRGALSSTPSSGMPIL